MSMFNTISRKDENTDIQELKERVVRLENNIGSLMDLLGFCGRVGGWIGCSDDEVFVPTSNYHPLNRDRLPVKSSDFNLLLKHLNLKVEDEKTERKITSVK